MDQNTHFYFLFFIGFAVLFGLITACFSLLLGRQSTDADSAAPYTGGFDDLSSPKNAFTVRFFLMALFFILLTAEAVLLMPWMIKCQSGGLAEAGGALCFLILCVVGGVFNYKRGAMRWK